MKTIEVNQELLTSIRIELVKVFEKNLNRSDLKLKGIEDPVTAMDLAISEEFFALTGARGFDSSAVLSEEHKEQFSADLSRFWVIDPIDGTKEFLQRIPEYVVSVGFVEGANATAGFVHNPENGFFISVAKGVVAEHWPEQLRLPENSLLVSRSEIRKGLFQNLRFPCEVIPMGSIAYKLGIVAAGKARAVVSMQPKNSWDVCAGVALVNFIGGVVTNLKGERLEFSQPTRLIEDGLIACANPADLSIFLDAIKSRR